MSYLGQHNRDLFIPPRPMHISMASAVGARPPLLRFTLSRPRHGPLQEAARVGFVALALSWAAAEIAFLLWG